MDNTSRWLVWTGPLFAVGFIVSVLFLEGETPSDKASAERVMDYYNAHQGRSLVSAFLAPLGATLLVLFAAHLRAIARGRGDSGGTGPTVLLSGAILWAAGILVGSTTTLALVQAADHDQAQIAQTMNVLANSGWVPFIGGLAVMLIGAGLTVLSTGILPRWMGWVAAVVGVVSLAGPGGFLGFFVAPLWLLVAGVLLARTPSGQVPAA
jgi:hypothetical protein